MPIRANFKDFYIRVGKPGAYAKNMVYEPAFGAAATYNCHVQHAPFSIMNKIKNVVVQTWRDEDGDDVWLPQVSGSNPGEFVPDIKHEAVDYNVSFVYQENSEMYNANADILAFIRRIEGRWLQIFDTYTGIGYDGVYLVDVDDNPKFRRRESDTVIFELKFKVNGMPTDKPFEEITA